LLVPVLCWRSAHRVALLVLEALLMSVLLALALALALARSGP
jgi:hypothetical protein